MPLRFHKVRATTSRQSLDLDLSFEDGVIVGITGSNGAGKSELLRLVAGELGSDSGTIDGFEGAGLASASLDSADPAAVRASLDGVLESGSQAVLVGPCLALTDSEYQTRTLRRFDELRRRGSIVLVVSHDLALLERHCDEVVVLEEGRVQDRGDPRLVVEAYRNRLIAKQRDEAPAAEVRPVSRHGDGRARVATVQILGADQQPTNLVRSGEDIQVHVRLVFQEHVDAPVVGVLIRSRVGINVYGTNTELEKTDIGPCSPGDEVELRFAFKCDLCAEQYTLTVASHDPDGTAHDWLEEAIVFTVSDSRYTTGVANLHAQVEVLRPKRLPQSPGRGER